jgi:hypothetical protein
MRARDQRRMADVRVVWCGALCLLVALWSCDEGGQRGEQMTNVDPIEDRDMGSFDVLGDLSSDEDVLDEEVDASLVDCLGDDDCDDGVFCNGAERCFEGVCYENPQRVCVDLTDCTVDVCDEEGDACAYTPDAGLCGAGQVCDPKAGCFTPRECVRDEDCDDGVFCDGEERCVEERCAPGEPPSCADEVGCTVDGCVESARQCQRTPDNTLCLEGELCDPEQGGCVPQPPCAEDADCDDGRFCNGVERCDQAQGACVSGAPPAVEDGIGCTLDGCDESRGEVVHVPSAARCDNGLFCDGVERCDVEAGCVAGAAPTVDDGVVCTADACDEEVDEVVHVAQDGVCDNGLFCDGVERCDVEAGCVGGAAPEVDDGVDCTEDACDEEADEVVHSPSDVACDNGLFCDGVERCDVVEGCVAGAAVLLEDGLACTEGRCDEAQDQVVQLPLHERCDNGLFCDGAERCDAVEGCVAGGAPVVDDGVDCTEDACDEEADEVVHRPLDARCDDGQLCSGEERCDVVLGCLDGDALELDDGVLCTVDRCDDATGEVSHVPLDGRCDDGLFCNGVETCDVNGGCRPGVPPVVDDGVSCTLDVCDEEGDVVVHIPMPDRCNNGLFCDGVETCDVVRDCQAGTAPVLTDGVNCTNDTCDEANDRVVHTPVNSRCDNGMFCDGVETCDVVRDCQAGTAPVLSDGVSCTNDTCDEVNDRVVHAPVNSRCDNGLFCDGVETCDVVRDCRAGTAPVLTDGVNCTNDTCDEANDRVVHAPVNSRCDNGLFCDGVETCDVVRDCQAGTAPVLSDGVSCTNDTCDEVNDRVVHAPVNSRCDNGLFCDGVETCDVVRDCQAGTAPVLSDGVSCTNDTCDEVNDRVVHTPVNSRCDNGMFCDGVET